MEKSQKKTQQANQSEDYLTASFMITCPFLDADTLDFQKANPSENTPLEHLWRDLNSEDEVFEFSKRLIDERLGLAMKILADQSS